MREPILMPEIARLPAPDLVDYVLTRARRIALATPGEPETT